MTEKENGLKVCCFPLSAKENDVLDIMYEPIKNRGVKLSDYNWFSSNFLPCDIFHVHWPDAVLMGNSLIKTLIKLCAFLFSVFVFKIRRVPVIYSVHNVGSHDQNHPIIENILWFLFLPNVKIFVHMNSESIKKIKRKFPKSMLAQHIVIPLPYYPDDQISNVTKSDARRIEGICENCFVVFSFGLIRPYKGLEDLISAFLAWGQQDSRLIICGRLVDEKYGALLKKISKNDPRIIIDFCFIEKERLNRLIAAADVIAITHKSLNNSGVAIMALSRGRPILAPRLGAIVDLENELREPWVYSYEGTVEAVYLNKIMVESFKIDKNQKPDLTRYSPDVIGESMVCAYKSLF